jgi:hypothetical protein
MLLFLIVSCLLIVLFPFTQNQFYIPTVAIEVLYNFFIIFAIYLISQHKQVVAVSVFISLLAITLIAFDKWIESRALLLTGLAMEIILFSMAIVLIIRHVMRYKKITEDKIYGAISAYLLIGIAWALLYTCIEIYQPHSFLFTSGFLIHSKQVSTHRFYFSEFLYFSYVTLSTLGYGDIVPTTHLARLCASLQAVFGQLYVAVLIARLVGIHITHMAHKK